MPRDVLTRRQLTFALAGLPLLPLAIKIRDDRLVIRDGWVLRVSDLAANETA